MLKQIMRRRDKLVARRLAKFFEKMLKAYENVDYNHASNGEERVLAGIGVFAGGGVIFDVGANMGNYTKLVLERIPESHVYAFEVVPETYAELELSVGSTSRATLVNLGLADKSGPIQLKYPGPKSPRTTVFDYPGHKDFSWIEGQFTTGDAYCLEHEIDHIDFLKMDVEGAEHMVLNGFGRMLAEGKIRVIQFEYGYVNALSHYLLADFYKFFSTRNYIVGKIYPTGVLFKEYRLEDENFWGPNYLAIHKDESDLIRQLAC